MLTPHMAKQIKFKQPYKLAVWVINKRVPLPYAISVKGQMIVYQI